MAVLDILTPEEAWEAAQITSTSALTSRVEAMSTGISGAIDRLCGPVVYREVTEVYAGLNSSIILRTTPVAEITEVVETTGTTPTTLTDDDWLLEASGVHAMLHRRTGGYATVWAYGDFNIEVTYVAGRFATTNDVDEFWKAGVKSILAEQWSRESARWARNPQGDEFLPDGPFDLYAAVRTRFPYELLGPGIG